MTRSRGIECDPDASPEVRARARAFIASRLERNESAAGASELEAMTWIAGAGEDADLEVVVLPALVKTRGPTDNGQAMAQLAAQLAGTRPVTAAHVLKLLVAGDRWVPG